MIWFWLVFSSTTTSAVPVAKSFERNTWSWGMPSSSMRSRGTRESWSVPILVTIRTSAPTLCAATHWLNPLPPGPIWK